MLQSTQESVCQRKFGLHDLALDKDMTRRQLTVERILQDTRTYSVNAWNQEDQYMAHCQGVHATVAYNNFTFEAHCQLGLTCQCRLPLRDNINITSNVVMMIIIVFIIIVILMITIIDISVSINS